MVCNLPLSVSMLPNCLAYALVSLPSISKHFRSKNIFQRRFCHESLALRYLRNLLFSFHIVTEAIYEIVIPKNTLRPHTIPNRFNPNSIPDKFPIASLCHLPLRTKLAQYPIYHKAWVWSHSSGCCPITTPGPFFRPLHPLRPDRIEYHISARFKKMTILLQYDCFEPSLNE